MKYIYWLIIGLLAVLLTLQTCKKNKPCDVIAGTTVVHDTIQGTVGAYEPTPSAIDSTWPDVSRGTVKKTVPGSSQTRTSLSGSAEDFFTADAAPAPGSPAKPRAKPSLNKTDPITYYKDSLELPDSLGKVYAFDKIQGNRIASRSWSFQVYKTTVTNNIEDRRNKWFIGLQDLGNQTEPVKWIGGSLAMMNKREKNIYTVSAGPMNGKVYYQLGLYFKIGK